MADKVGNDKTHKHKRYGYTQGVDQLMRRITPKVAPKKGLLDGIIIQDWTSIVGRELAEQCVPQKIVFPRGQRQNGVLHIGVFDGASGMLLQHKSPQILTKVNQQYGYPAVSKVIMVGAAPTCAPIKTFTVPTKTLTPEQQEKLETILQGIEDGPLKDALRDFGMGVLG